MKKLFILSLLIVSNFSFAQSTTSLKVSKSPEYKERVKSKEVIAIHTSANQETVIVRSTKKKFFLLDVFDANLEKIFSEKMQIEYKEWSVGDLFYNNQLKLFTVYAPKSDERIVYSHTLDLTTKTYTK